MDDLNNLLTFPSFERQRGHSSLARPRAGLYTVSRQLGQFRYAMGRAAYPSFGAWSTYG
jgi:hypothetical protein